MQRISAPQVCCSPAYPASVCTGRLGSKSRRKPHSDQPPSICLHLPAPPIICLDLAGPPSNLTNGGVHLPGPPSNLTQVSRPGSLQLGLPQQQTVNPQAARLHSLLGSLLGLPAPPSARQQTVNPNNLLGRRQSALLELQFKQSLQHRPHSPRDSKQSARQETVCCARLPGRSASFMVLSPSSSPVCPPLSARTQPPRSPRLSQSPRLSPRHSRSARFSPTVPGSPRFANVSGTSRSLELDEVQLTGVFCDPAREPLRSQLLQRMSMPPNASVEPMRGGGCNAGMWLVCERSQAFVLKLVKSGFEFLGQASESAKFLNLSLNNPGIDDDLSLAFPCNIVQCIGQAGSKSYELLVMRQVPGLQFSDFIRQKLQGYPEELMTVLERFGIFLADFHVRYKGMQHGDLTPANVFFDPSSGRFTLIDVADLAPHNPVIQSDKERFVSGLRGLSMLFGKALLEEGKARFELGYDSRGRACTW